MKLAILFLSGPILLMLPTCGAPSPDLPPIQASSAHFRYHARAPADVQSDILDRLERNRADFYQFMGLDDENVTDYYYFTDDADRAANSPCPIAGADCALRHSAYASIPFHEHELIHTYMFGVGAPSVPVSEGTAEAVGCIRQAGGYGTSGETDWRRAVHDYPTSDLTIYAASQRFVLYLMKQMGVAETVAYYRADPFTLDPASFAQDFQRFWGSPIDDVWSAAVGSGAPEPTLPICPCEVDSIAIGSGETSVIHPNDAAYRPLPPGPGPLTLDVSTSGFVELDNCGRDTTSMQLFEVGGSTRHTVVLQADDDHYFLTFDGSGTDTVTASQDLALQPTCAGLSTFAVDRASQLALAAPRAGGATWYLRLSTTHPATLARFDIGSGALSICSDCSQTSCQSLAPSTGTASVEDGMVLRFTPDSSTAANGLDVVTALLY
jgi:hypothetical protein